MRTALIGLDWGTSSFRAYRIEADGRIVERRSARAGILQVEGSDFAGTLTREIGAWLAEAPDAPVLASGMITSRQGWVEVPYVRCPAGAAELARDLLAHELADGRQIHFVPGLSSVADDGVPDVMRGEETQIVGELGDATMPQLMVLPGTHSKWALAEGGRITWFATFMTGEVFAALKDHTILGRLMTGEAHDEATFARGLAYAGEGGSGLLKRLFSARTLGLFEQLPASGIGSYLSGLLIGTEIAEALAWTRARGAERAIRVIGGAELADLYCTALETKGLRARRGLDDAAAHGLHRIARAAELIR